MAGPNNASPSNRPPHVMARPPTGDLFWNSRPCSCISTPRNGCSPASSFPPATTWPPAGGAMFILQSPPDACACGTHRFPCSRRLANTHPIHVRVSRPSGGDPPQPLPVDFPHLVERCVVASDAEVDRHEDESTYSAHTLPLFLSTHASPASPVRCCLSRSMWLLRMIVFALSSPAAACGRRLSFQSSRFWHLYTRFRNICRPCIVFSVMQSHPSSCTLMLQVVCVSGASRNEPTPNSVASSARSDAAIHCEIFTC
jgi:hypothetical protein